MSLALLRDKDQGWEAFGTGRRPGRGPGSRLPLWGTDEPAGTQRGKQRNPSPRRQERNGRTLHLPCDPRRLNGPSAVAWCRHPGPTPAHDVARQAGFERMEIDDSAGFVTRSWVTGQPTHPNAGNLNQGQKNFEGPCTWWNEVAVKAGLPRVAAVLLCALMVAGQAPMPVRVSWRPACGSLAAATQPAALSSPAPGYSSASRPDGAVLLSGGSWPGRIPASCGGG